MNNFLKLETLELNIVSTCNLKCRSCSHFAPIAKSEFLDPVHLEAQLEFLVKNFRFKQIRLLGGEPLLHPDLIGIIRMIQDSHITERIVLVTNGLLLSTKTNGFLWDALDEIVISEYPKHILPDEERDMLNEIAIQYNVDLLYLDCAEFRESYSEIGTEDKNLIQRIYNTCDVVWNWKCYTLVDYYLYRCPQSYFIPKYLKTGFMDGIEITTDPSIRGRVLEHLNSPEPSKSCQYCLGTSGKTFPHQTVARNLWRTYQNYSTENLIENSNLLL